MSSRFTVRACLFTLLFCFAFPRPALHAQQPAAADEVIRITTELIQSPVIVLDKQGKFVPGLTRDQFELIINNQPQPVAFFDEVTAGTPGEVEKFEAARKGAATAVTPTVPVYGRTIIFFIDDFHLNSDSVNRTRTAVLNFIENSLGQNDRAMVLSTSGQIGFLQQLTDNKDVLRAAINRLKHRDIPTTDEARPPMTAYQAFAIENGDSGVLANFADTQIQEQFTRTSKEMPQLGGILERNASEQHGEQNRRSAESAIKSRARNVLTRYAAVSNSTLAGLKQAMGSLNQLPGSKLVFLISDGFFLNQKATGELHKLNEITSGAVRGGSVVYSIQAAGLGTSLSDAKSDVRFGLNSTLGSPMIGQDSALQAPLSTVATDTGGRALFNSNSLDGSIREALGETAKYYLLAWRPDPEAKRSDLFQRVSVKVKDHPDWSVRVQKGYFLAGTGNKTAPTPATTKTPAAAAVDERTVKMRETLSAFYPVRDLPVLINLNFLDEPTGGPTLSIGSRVSIASLTPAAAEKQVIAIDLAGVVLNDEGKTVASFSGPLKVDLSATGTPQAQAVSHVDEIKVKPGLYQVRVAAREDKTGGVTGSANEWVLVPDLSGGKLALSGIFLTDAAATDANQKARFSIDRRFDRAGRLRFFTDIYNAARGVDGKSAPDLSVQLRVTRDDKILTTSPQLKVSLEGITDLTRIPYGAQLPLARLGPGRYVLSVTVTDNVAKTTATQSVKFTVE